jgi:hypothetical protein
LLLLSRAADVHGFYAGSFHSEEEHSKAAPRPPGIFAALQMTNSDRLAAPSPLDPRHSRVAHRFRCAPPGCSCRNEHSAIKRAEQRAAPPIEMDLAGLITIRAAAKAVGTIAALESAMDFTLP